MKIIKLDGQDYPIAPICSVTRDYVKIVCPYCGQLHSHSNDLKDHQDLEDSYRRAHCSSKQGGLGGYFIEGAQERCAYLNHLNE